MSPLSAAGSPLLPVTLVVAARNCEDRISGTLTPWINVVEQMIVVDELSSDQTAELAKRLGASVYVQAAPDGNFDRNRKFGMQQTKTEWILYLDTDERPTPELVEELRAFFKNEALSKRTMGVRIPNHFYFLGRRLRYGIYNPRSSEVRLFRRTAYDYPCESGFHRGITVTGEVHPFKAAYRHFNVNTLSEWFIKTNQYTEVDALSIQTTPENPLRIVWKFFSFFFKYYVRKQGFRDGTQGFLAVVYFGLYHFTLRFKIWEKQMLKAKQTERDYLNPLAIPKR